MLTTHLDSYLTYRAAVDWMPKTCTSARSTLNATAAFLARHGHRRWPTVTAADLDAYLLHLQALGRRRATRDHAVWALRGFYAWLIDRGLILTNHALDLHPLAADNQELPPAPLTEPQVRALFDAIGEHGVVSLRDRLVLDLLYSAGLRLGEALNLRVDDLDIAALAVHVRATKTNDPRSVPMQGSLLESARAFLAVRREWLVGVGPDPGFVLLGERGRRFHSLMPGRLLAKLGKATGVHCSPHTLRRSIGVHLLNRGVDLKTIQTFLGHKDLGVTCRAYLRLSVGELRKAYDDAFPPLLPMPAHGG